MGMEAEGLVGSTCTDTAQDGGSLTYNERVSFVQDASTIYDLLADAVTRIVVPLD